MENFKFNTIGFVRSGFKEKFGVPRQSGLVKSLISEIEIVPPYANEEAFRELGQFSHIWVVFVFHQNLAAEWHPTVRPPRLGGNTRVGVFASRSPFRPNPIGLSAVELVDITQREQKIVLRFKGGDLVDGSPVLDIKPYIPYADKLDADDGYALCPSSSIRVNFTSEAADQIKDWEAQSGQPLLPVVSEMLALDPRPAYRGSGPDKASYGMRLYDLNILFKVDGDQITVISLEKIEE